MAARVILKCYELGNNKVNTLTQDQVRAKYSPKLFPASQGKFWEKWYALKDRILAKGKDIKKVDDIIYYSHVLSQNSFLVFAIGDDKKETLEKIYLKEVEENKGNTGDNQINDTQEETKTEPTPVKSVATGETWDLTDTSKSINEHVKAILDKKNITGKFNDDQSKEVIKLLGSGNTIKDIMDKEEWTKIAPTLIKSLKAIEPVMKYTVFSAKKIAELIQNIGNEAKSDNFAENLEAAKEYTFDFNSIKA